MWKNIPFLKEYFSEKKKRKLMEETKARKI